MTIYDIARQAEVSASTVSRVINHKPGIKESTRKKVQALLDAGNYTPDIAARGLVMQSSRFIGILIEDIRVSHHTESAYVIEQAMTRRGYTCITFSTGPSPEQKAQYIRILEQRRVEGAILIGSMFGTPEVAQSIRQHLSGIPVVIANGTLALPNVYGVLVDEERGLKNCVAYLAQRGRRQFAFMLDAKTPSNRSKLAGFAAGLQAAGLPGADRVFDALAEGSGPEDVIDRGQAAVAEVLAACPEVDALLCSTDLVAIGCLRGLKAMNIAVPGQISVIGVDNTLYGKLYAPALTTLDNKLVEVSLNAARVLLDALVDQAVSHTLMLLPEIIVRESS